MGGGGGGVNHKKVLPNQFGFSVCGQFVAGGGRAKFW